MITNVFQTDVANRSTEIHWPLGYDPAKVDLFSHNEINIDASCERVWGHLVDAAKWQEWYPNSKDVRINGNDKTLQANTVWHWNTFGQSFGSRVHEYVPHSRIGWFGYAPGPEPASPPAYHTWYLVPSGEACHVVTEEVRIGEDAVKLRKTDEGQMHRGHDLWLAGLKWISEGK
jgi:uncharacterized protein YndB with AHSA1/START domain